MINKLLLKIDITDWNKEAHEDKFFPESEDDIIAALEREVHTAKTARATIVSREIGKAPDDILPENKLLLMAGAMHDISKMVSRRKIKIETSSGKSFEVPSLLGKPAGEDSDTSYIPIDSNKAQEWAENYLDTVVIGHIRNRLATIYLNGGDIEEIAMQLKLKIDEITKELLEPVLG